MLVNPNGIRNRVYIRPDFQGATLAQSKGTVQASNALGRAIWEKILVAYLDDLDPEDHLIIT